MAEGRNTMILIGVGSNMDGPWGSPHEAVTRAIRELDRWPCAVTAASTLLVTPPFGRKNQPDFVNAVFAISTSLPPGGLMRRLHMLERSAGRTRRIRWGPRTLDLDLLDYNGVVCRPTGNSHKPLSLPHPGIAERLFVLEPLAEIAPRWHHPVSRETAIFTIRKLRRLSST